MMRSGDWIAKALFAGSLLGFLVLSHLQANAVEAAPPLEWSLKATGLGDDLGTGVTLDDAGNVYFATWHGQSAQVGDADVLPNLLRLAKFDPSGAPLWQKSFADESGATNPTQTRLLIDPTGHLVASVSSVAGNYRFAGAMQKGLSFVKLDHAGNIVWAHGDGTGRDAAPTSAMDADGNYLFLAAIRGNFQYGGYRITAGDEDLIILQVGAGGGLLWARRGIGPVESQARGLASDAEGNVYASGTFRGSLAFGGLSTNSATASSEGFVVKLDRNGQPVWLRDLRGDGNVRLGGLTMLNDGSVALCGFFDNAIYLGSQKVPGSSAFLGKIDPDGGFRTIYKLADRIFPADLALGRDGELVLAGTFSGSTVFGGAALTSRGARDYLLAKMSTSGIARWAKPFGYVGDESYDGQIALSAAGEIYAVATARDGLMVDGVFQEGAGGQDVFLLKLSAPSKPLPVFLVAPAPQEALVGGSATFTAVATNALRYQWYFNNVLIVGATESSYRVSNVTLADFGDYSVAAANGSGTTRSVAASLTVSGSLRAMVSTIAGQNTPGYLDATNRLAVRFNQPQGLAYWASGIIAVADSSNQVVRLVANDGATITYAGLGGSAGYLNGPATLAQFRFPLGLTIDPRSTDIVLADSGNHAIRRISADGLRTVSTIAGRPLRGYRDGRTSVAQFSSPSGLIFDRSGNIFIADTTNHVVRKIGIEGFVTTFAGRGTLGWADGTGTNAAFNLPAALAMDTEQNVYVTELGNHAVRKISPLGVVVTFAGGGTSGFVDGPGGLARFSAPAGIAADPLGNLYIADQGNHAVRKVDAAGNVVTVVGTGLPGYQDGVRNVARLNAPAGIMLHRNGSLYVADTLNHSIRRIDLPDNPTGIGPRLSYRLNPASLIIEGASGSSFRIETATASADAPFEWKEADTITLRFDVDEWPDPEPPTAKARFFRLVELP